MSQEYNPAHEALERRMEEGPKYFNVGFRHCSYLETLEETKEGKEPDCFVLKDALETLDFYIQHTDFESEKVKDNKDMSMFTYTQIYQGVYSGLTDTAHRIQTKLKEIKKTIQSVQEGKQISPESLEMAIIHCKKVNEVCVRKQLALRHPQPMW